MPGDAASRVAGRPLRFLSPSAGRFADGHQDGLPKRLDGFGVSDRGRAQLQPDLGRIRGLGAEDMVDDLVAVAPATPRALSQVGRRFRHHAVEGGPACNQEGADALGLGLAQLLGVGGRGNSRRTEVGGCVALDALDHPERRTRAPRQRETRQLGHGRIARRVRGERLERRLLVLAGTRPAQPVQRRRKDAFGADFDIDRDGAGSHASDRTRKPSWYRRRTIWMPASSTCWASSGEKPSSLVACATAWPKVTLPSSRPSRLIDITSRPPRKANPSVCVSVASFSPQTPFSAAKVWSRRWPGRRENLWPRSSRSEPNDCKKSSAAKARITCSLEEPMRLRTESSRIQLDVPSRRRMITAANEICSMP